MWCKCRIHLEIIRVGHNVYMLAPGKSKMPKFESGKANSFSDFSQRKWHEYCISCETSEWEQNRNLFQFKMIAIVDNIAKIALHKSFNSEDYYSKFVLGKTSEV